MTTNKKSTLFYHNWLPSLRKLTKAQAGEVLIALLEFDAEGKEPHFDDPMTDLAFTNYVEVVKMNRQKYDLSCERKAEYQRKKKAEKEQNSIEDHTTLYNSIEQYTTLSDIDIDTDTDKDMDMDKDIDIAMEMEMEMEIDKDIEENAASPTADEQISSILQAWNSQKLIQSKVDRIAFGTRRWNNTFLCIAEYGFNGFMDTIMDLDNNAYFHQWHPTYDWFCDPNNFVKVWDGNYKQPIRKAGEIDWEAL